MDSNPSSLLLFLSLFHIAGAIALGWAVHSIWAKFRGEEGPIFIALFFAVWGTLFGCIPFSFGLDPQLPIWFPVTQVAIWGITFGITAFFGKRILIWLKPVFTLHSGLMLFGGVFMASGIAGGFLAFGNGEILTALLLGGVFGLIGLGIFLLGLIGLFRGLNQ